MRERPSRAAARACLALALALALAAAPVPTAVAQPAPAPGSAEAPFVLNAAVLGEDLESLDRDAVYVPGEVIVRFKSAVSSVGTAAAHRRAGSLDDRPLGGLRGLEIVRIKRGMSVEAAVKAYEAMPEVAYAEPNYVVRAAVMPNDPAFGDLWGLNNTGQTGGTPDADIDAPEAWNVTTGSNAAVVAVLDTGVDYEHPELAGNLWTNPDEIPGNLIDDDGNGYVDDVHGADMVNSDGDPMDDNGHGTHVAGTIAAEGNNALGVAGVNWDVAIMPVKILGATGIGSTARAIAAYQYAAANGARVLNNSWGGYYAFSQAEYDAIAAIDALFVCAAGNERRDIDGAQKFYPAAYNLPNIVSVGASDNSDAPAKFSNFGAANVDVFAPGTAIKSTWPGSREATIVAGATETRLAYEDFTSLGDWNQYRYSGQPWQPWTLNTASFVSPPSSASALGYVNNQYSHLRRKTPVDLSGATYPGMRFRLRCNTEPGYDFIRWGVWDQSANTYTDLGRGSGTTSGQFVTVLRNMTSFAGQSDIYPWFELSANSSNSSANGYEGAWVDDLEVFDVSYAGSGSPWRIAADFTNAYATLSGTSMATPHVSGIAALLLARAPSLTTSGLKGAIMSGAEPKSALTGLCVTGARANALDSLVFANGVPQAVNDAYETARNTTLNVPAPGVLSNDTDADGDPLTATKVTDPSHGSVSFNSNGSFTYVPTTGYSGTDSFTYKARDGIADSNVAIVTITIGPNRAPVAAADGYSTAENTALDVPARGVLANDVDPDGEQLQAIKVTDPTHGTLTLNPDGSFAYSPEPHWFGIDSFTYKANDRALDSNTVTVTITVTQAPPMLISVYRFYNVRNGSHFYTPSADEANHVILTWPDVYAFEGVAYRLDQRHNSQPIFRFYNARTGAHFYTASSSERDVVIATWPEVFVYEGPTYSVTPVAEAGKPPVYRFYNLRNGSHFYTASAGEADNVIASWPDVYRLEGTAFWLGQ
ncbi:MAG: tandem-95 repeat protein [Actinobacteria bacterium]|nr:tandem-95 repeat protein [Actinomycetota bacterium]